MSAYYRNNWSEEDPDYPDYSGSQNRTQGYLKTQGYPDVPGPLNNPDYPGTRSNPYSVASRTRPDYPGSLAEPNYPRSLSNPDYSGTRSNAYSAASRTSPDHPTSLPEPDYSEFQSHPYHRASSRQPDYPGSQRNPDFAGSSSSGNYAGSRTHPDHFGSLEPDYPGAQSNSDHPGPRANLNHPGSRKNLEHTSFRINPYADSLGKPDYPGADIQPNSPPFFGEPDYPSAEDNQNLPSTWREPDYSDAENGHDYGSSETPKMTRGVLSRTSSIQPSFRHRSDDPVGSLWGENDYPEGIEMASMEMANSYGHSLPGAPGSGYVNPAYVGESGPVHAYGNPPLSECDWHKSPQGQKLIASLIPMTSRDRIKAIRNQPRTMEEKRNLRKIVDKEKSKQTHRILQLNCCIQCLNSISRAYRRSKNSLSEILNSISLWQKTLKIIGGKFGTSVLSYFNFLRWLLKFNIFSFILNFSFIIIPQFTVAKKNTLQFTGLEFFTGVGYFRDTVMYYGFYTNSTIQHGNSGASYNMQLAYIFTIGACLTTCFFSLLFSMAKYFRNNFINPHIYSGGITKLIFCWDFTVTHEKAVKLKQKNLSTEIRENLSELRQENSKLTFNQLLTRFSAYMVAWVVSTGVAIACCAAVYYLAEYNLEFLKTHSNPGAVLLLPFVVSCINLAVPCIYSMFRLVERYEMPRHEVYVLLIRNIFLKISIIGILCYYWLNTVALSGEECWETLIGQDIYRLLLMDFVFSLVNSFLGEFLRRIIGMQLITSLGLQEFDIARNVLELIYAQTLVWIGIFFCPLLPFIQMIMLFIMFYSKNISLMMNFQPPSKAWRASQMMTFFIFLLFFPSFTGVLCTLAITIWRIITYLYWQITEGRKIMIRLLHEQIINEGKDKMFLIEKLIKLQDMEKKANPSSLVLERREVEQQGFLHLGEHDGSLDLRSRRSVQEGNPRA
ncbi:transmembrane channel like 5 [Homo sapiens]|uniref:Isoform 2 of Transmembrane channel-like protein 5 n=1 Tax=Homo sapiens TaxID=9606 RepID=Q6UXY8-2|nr:transmembrane channel-like protein 5 isoform b [Homo sapiens]AAQ88522.1 SAYY8238 [Homo sapiens]KAI2577422.1 transmembrane channel like 5 [Homo sapiens]KAI4053830.1 transmembrane channel like 5 [Homo sapiens]|eukprot:NP_001098719.1 transmembrane channel-like protein 5 isoform b [Homo sapiens]